LSPSTPKRTVFRRGPLRMTRVEFLDQRGAESAAFRMWESLTIRVWYECDGPPPEDTLGLAIGFHREGDLSPICQFSTARATRDSELPGYDRAPFRRRAASHGSIEARMSPIQLVDGTYLVSIGLLPNRPDVVEFYEFRYLFYRLTVLRDGFSLAGLAFYPIVDWSHRPNASDGTAE
jgi:hypothetical protein